MYKQTLILLLFVFSTLNSSLSLAQSKKKSTPKRNKIEKKGIIYFTENSYSIGIRNNGWLAEYNKCKIINATKKSFWEAGIGNLRHEKETKSPTTFEAQTGVTPRNFVYGKKNSFFGIYYRYGFSKKLTSKASENGLDVNFYYSAGPVLGLAKAYYLNIIYLSSDNPTFEIKATRYSAATSDDFLASDRIYGYAGFSKGLFRLTPNAGLSANIGLSIDWSRNEEVLKCVDLGVLVDAYAYNAPIMANTSNHQVFPSVYVKVRWGKRK